MSVMRNMLATCGVVCIGYGIWIATAPSEDKRREMLRNLPESNPVTMEETRKRNALIMQVLKEATETKDNLARGTGPPK